MWLIRCSDFALVRFDGMMSRDPRDRPGYLILSHTWGAEEVTFSDMANIEAAKRKKGWVKIEGICQVARGTWRNVDYAWVDTCCIDKSSSAELTESINSMYVYYREARACIAYLEDLKPGEGLPTEEQLGRCRWFTRGWTLQELIAPDTVWFYDTDWKFRCERWEVLEAIQGITDIDMRVLGRERRPLDDISVAQKMSWAAGRTTTRIEDRAYSLLGIFGVNMPLIYGEGQGAFRRLQEAILQQINDLSIFAWEEPSPSDGLCGFLAPRPESFSGAGTIELMDDPNVPTPSFTAANAAVEMLTSLGIHNGRRHPYSNKDNRLDEDANPTMVPDSDNRLLHLHCTMSMRQDTDSSHGRNDIRVVFLLLRRTRRGLMRASGFGLWVCRQSEVRFLEPVEVVLPKSVPRIIVRRSTEVNQYMDRRYWEVLQTDFSGVYKYLNDRMPFVEYTVEATYHPEHLFVSNPNCFRIDNNPHFVGVVRVEFLKPADDRLGKEWREPYERDLFWLVCGKSHREDGETEMVLPKSVPKSILRLSTGINQYTDWGYWEALDIDLSRVKKYLNVILIDVKATHYPEHLFIPGLNCFRIDDNPHFVGVVRIECLRRTCDEVGKHKEPPKERPDFFWIVCGKSPREDGKTEIWATMYTKDMVKSGLLIDVGVYCEGDFRNPLAISNIGNRLRNLRSGSGWGETMATKQKLTMTMNRKPMEVSWSTSRQATQRQIASRSRSVWTHYLHINAKDGHF